jgi:hypothetical protein
VGIAKIPWCQIDLPSGSSFSLADARWPDVEFCVRSLEYNSQCQATSANGFKGLRFDKKRPDNLLRLASGETSRKGGSTNTSASNVTDASDLHPEKHSSQITSTEKWMEMTLNRSDKIHGH